ncbi:unnamed protein product, partial [Rotaria sp. Silwood1]
FCRYQSSVTGFRTVYSLRKPENKNRDELKFSRLNNAQHPMNEYRHDDFLTYFWRGQSYSVIITCFTNTNDEGKIITLAIGSTVHGKMIQIPLGQYSIAQNYVKELEQIFDAELKNLLLSIYNEQKAAQQ